MYFNNASSHLLFYNAILTGAAPVQSEVDHSSCLHLTIRALLLQDESSLVGKAGAVSGLNCVSRTCR